MYNKDYSKIKYLTGIAAAAVFIVIYLILLVLFPSLKEPSGEDFSRKLIGGYLSFFIPMNMISWLCFGQFGGILILFFSCFSIIIVVLKYGVLYYNIYIFLFGISAFAGYRIFLRIMLARNQLLANAEELEAEENVLSLQIHRRQKDTAGARSRVEGYMALKGIIENLSATLNLKEIANLIVEKALNIVGKSDRALLFMVDEKRQELELLSSRQVYAPAQLDAKKAQIFDTWILKQRRPLIIEDLNNDFRFSAEALKDPEDREFKSTIGAPLVSARRVVGVLRLDSRSKAAYTQDDLRLLDIMSDLAAISIENAVLYQRTNELAVTDSLTGLYVQRFFKEKLDAELKTAQAKGERFSILMIDLDHFKECNDKYGHAAGDILLSKIAGILGTVLTENCPQNIISRYGGEEFAVILRGTDKRGAIRISEDIRKRTGESIFTLRRAQIKTTVSIGISSFPEDGRQAQAVLKRADENLYKAKEGGRNRICPSSI